MVSTETCEDEDEHSWEAGPGRAGGRAGRGRVAGGGAWAAGGGARAHLEVCQARAGQSHVVAEEGAVLAGNQRRVEHVHL